MAVGGSGGHFSPEYFDYVLIPKFPNEVQAEIVSLYHNNQPRPDEVLTLDTFVEWHRLWNERLGLWQLDREMSSPTDPFGSSRADYRREECGYSICRRIRRRFSPLNPSFQAESVHPTALLWTVFRWRFVDLS